MVCGCRPQGWGLNKIFKRIPTSEGGQIDYHPSIVRVGFFIFVPADIFYY